MILHGRWVTFDKKSDKRHLVKLCNKSFGIKSRNERIEADREREHESDRNVRIRSFNMPKVETVQESPETKPFSTLGDIIKFKEGK